MNKRNLTELLENIWQDFQEGVENRKHPFHLAQLATSLEHRVFGRTIVLRKVIQSSRQIFCHTDLRSGKVKQLNAHSHATWTFYDVDRQIQIRVSGQSVIHHQNEVAKTHWENTGPYARRCYLTTQPATKIKENGSGFSPEILEEPMTLEKSLPGYKNFAVVSTTVDELDWLLLNRKGHQRAQFYWSESRKAFDGSWVVP